METVNDPYKKEVYHEWVIEWRDQYGDIQDFDRALSLSDIPCHHFDVKYPFGSTKLMLQRRAGCHANGLTELGYAYVNEGALPDTFDCGHKIPQRFRRQLEKRNRQQ